jgi:uncharacterized protein (TIGR03790 family)
MMRFLRALLLAALAAATVPARASEPHRFAAATVVLANANDPDSLAIAEAYRDFRGIPERNVIRLPLPTAQTISREEFVATLYNPLRAALLEREIFFGDFVGVEDVHGRKPVLLVENRMRYLVLCRGVPLKVRGSPLEDDAPLLERYLGELRRQMRNRSFAWPQPFLKTQASVDSELALLTKNEWPLTAIVINPLRDAPPGARAEEIVRVARLDGPSKEAVLRALEGVARVEAEGLRGRAYFDIRSIDGNPGLKVGDDWIRAAAAAAQAAHFDTDVDAAGATIPVEARFDAPALYVGWYAGHVTGPFTLEGFRFAPGAIALHLHSFSAGDPSRTDRNWVGPLVEAGAAVTIGNVYEPYLSLTHDFGRFLELLLAGANVGDAAYASVSSLSWQWAVFGDPLYEPFKVDHAAMLAAARAGRDPALDPYVLLREMNRLEAAGKTMEARDRGLAALEERPHPALALGIAKLHLAERKPMSARLRLVPWAETERFEPQEWMLYAAIARELNALEASEEATRLYRGLLADPRLPRPIEKVLLRDGSAAALWTAPEESAAWKARYDAILDEERRAREEAEAKKRAEEEAKAAAAAEEAAP